MVTCKEDLQEYFGRFSAVHDAVIQKHRMTKQSRGFGFRYGGPRRKAADRILGQKHVLQGRTLNVTNCKGENQGATGDVTGLTKLYVSDLRQHHTEQDLEVAFSRFGALREVVVMRHQDTGEPRGFGFVTFAEHEQAKAAVASGFCTLGADQARCKVVFASPRPPPRGGPRVPDVSAARAARAWLWLWLPAGAAAGPGYGYGPPHGWLPAASTGLRAARPAPAAAAPAGLPVRAAGAASGARRKARLPSRRRTALPAVPPARRPGPALSALPSARRQGAAPPYPPYPQQQAPPPQGSTAVLLRATARAASGLRRRASAAAIRRCASSGLRCASGPAAVRRSAPGHSTAAPGGAPPQGQQYGAPPPAQQPSPYDGAPAYPARADGAPPRPPGPSY